MLDTKHTYHDLVCGKTRPEARFCGHVPTWPALDRFANRELSRMTWALGYIAFYLAFAPQLERAAPPVAEEATAL